MPKNKGARNLKKGKGSSSTGKAAAVEKDDDDIDAIVASLDKEKSDKEAAKKAKEDQARAAAAAAAKQRAEQAEAQRKQDAQDLVTLSAGAAKLADPPGATKDETVALAALRRAAEAAAVSKNLAELRKQTNAFNRRVAEIEAAKLEVQRLRGELAKQVDPPAASAAEGKLLDPIRAKIATALDEHRTADADKGIEALAKTIVQVLAARVTAARREFDETLAAARADAAKAKGFAAADDEFFDRYLEGKRDDLDSGVVATIGAATRGIEAVARDVAKLADARDKKTLQTGKVQRVAPGRPLTIVRTGGRYAVQIDANHPGADVGDEIEFVYTVAEPENAQHGDITAVTKAAAPDHSQTIDYAGATYEYAGSASRHFNDGYLDRLNIRATGDIKTYIVTNRARVQKTATAGLYRLATNSGATGQRPLDAIIFEYFPDEERIKVFHVQ